MKSVPSYKFTIPERIDLSPGESMILQSFWIFVIGDICSYLKENRSFCRSLELDDAFCIRQWRWSAIVASYPSLRISFTRSGNQLIKFLKGVYKGSSPYYETLSWIPKVRWFFRIIFMTSWLLKRLLILDRSSWGMIFKSSDLILISCMVVEFFLLRN